MNTNQLKKSLIRVQAILLCFVLLLSFMPLQSVFALDDQDQTANSDIIRTLALSYKLKGGTEFTDLTSPYKINDITKIESFHAKCSFDLKDYTDTNGAATRTVTSGDYYLIDLPEKLIVSNPAGGSILGNGGRAIAQYSFIEETTGNWKIKIEFTDYVDDPNEYDIYGQMEFDFTLDMTGVGEGSTTTIYIPIDNSNGISIDVTNPVPPPTKPVSLTKTVSSYNHLTRELVWNIKMMPDTGIFSGCVFTDTIDINRLDLKSIKHGSVTLVEGTDYTYDPLTGNIVYTIPDGRDGASYQNIVITTVAKRSIYGNLSATTISNQANLSGGDSYVDIDSNTASQTITPNWLGKSGTLFQGNKIQWTLTANTTQQSMYNAVITDNFQADVLLDKSTVKLGNTAITVYDNAHTPTTDTEVYGIYTVNGDGTAIFKIYLPRGKTNASTAKQTVTFITSVKSPDTVVTADPVYNNTATLDANYITDGDGEGTLPTVNLNQVGVSVPYISVVKGHSTISADDKRNGTITWTITAASNQSDYGKSTIVDTLPSDQDYIADEIYWGSTKINESTEPKAEISTDGRTLTITFNSFNALRTQQSFSVKTKIKQEVYGQNINRNFTNKAAGYLLDASTGSVLDTDSDDDSVAISNTVIAKSSSLYNDNTTHQGINPRVKFSIIINNNLMPLSDVVISDNLNNIVTEFKKSSESTFSTVSGVKWTYVPGTLSVTRSAGTLDSLDLAAIAARSTYLNDIITIDFGNGASVNDKYVITFTAELNVAQNDIFKENGTIRCKGNVAGIKADGLNTGVISSPATGNSEVKNEVLAKSGIQNVAEQQVTWSINLNQHRVALDSSRLVDTLPLGITLDPTSIKLYTNVIGTDGNFVTGSTVETQGTLVNFTYTYEPATGVDMEGRYTLTVNLPDNKTDYVLRFATDIDRSLLGKQITNSAYYVGESQVPENTNTSTMTFSSTSGGGSTTKSSVIVNKKSKDTGAAVDGAVFALHWLRNGDPNDAVFVRTLSTSNGSVIFRGLTRGEIYTITEVSAPNGYILDTPDPIQVVVPATGTGDASPLTFYNTPVKSGSWTPAAIKKLDGKSIIHTFNFELNDGTSTLLTGTTQTKLDNGDYTVNFSLNSGVNAADVLTFTDDYIFADTDAAGTQHLVTTKTFYMKEIPSALSGYGFDNKVYKIVVNVYNVKGQNDLKVVVEDGSGNVLSDNTGKFTADNTPVFLNTYRANGGIQLSAEKTVVGHSLAANQFSFELYEGSTLLQTVKNNTGMLVNGNTYTGNINFNVINYTQSDVGTKTYRILEKNTGLSGYTYDATEYTVTVQIDDNDDGTLASTVKSIQKTVGSTTTAANNVEITNQYTTTDIDVALNASKTLSGRVIANNQFSFKLNQVTSTGDFIKEIGIVTNTGENIALPGLTFHQSDIGQTFYYQVFEVNDGKPGYTYDSSVYTVKIEVSDNNDGTLTATESFTKSGQPVSSLSFSNSYNASGKTTVTAKKTLTGKALPDGQFGFAIQQFNLSDGQPIGQREVVHNTANGGIVFPEMTYTEADAGKEFYYRVTEINDGIGGYTYDSTSYTVCVSVTDNGDGTLDVQQKITEPAAATEITFANTYITADTYARLFAQKVLSGRVLEDKQFTFVLNSVTDTGELISEIQRMKNGADGSVTFNDINYTQSDMGKTYYYTISEKQDGSSGYAYDSSVYTVKVEIVDNNDGTLTANKTIFKGTDSVLSALFTNSYTTTDTTVQIAAEKTLTGRKLADGQFKYTLTLKGDGTQPDTMIEEVANSANGAVLFTPITYTQADMGKTFIYTLKEINEAKLGYEYDNTVYTIEVKVIDNGDGTLKTEVSAVKPGDADATVPVTDLTFSNVYTAKGSVQFTAKKELIGLKLTDKQFSFVLADEDGNILQTVYNDVDGNILFNNIFFNQDQLGEYHYKMYELSDNNEAYTYDKTVYLLTVTVTDNGDGTLTTATSVLKENGSDDDSVQSIKFVNQYHTQTKPSIPDTGDHSSIFYYGLLALLSAIIFILTKRKIKRLK